MRNLYVSWRTDLFLLSFSQSGLYVLIICMICRPQHSTYTDFFITMLIYLKIENLPIPRCMSYVMGKLPSPLWRKSNLESRAQWTHLNRLSSFYSLKQLKSLYEWLDTCSKWLLWTGILLPGLRNSSVFDSCYACQSFALRWCCLIFTKKQYAISSVLPSPYFTFKDLLHDSSSEKSKCKRASPLLFLPLFGIVADQKVFLGLSPLKIPGFMLGKGGRVTKPTLLLEKL